MQSIIIELPLNFRKLNDAKNLLNPSNARYSAFLTRARTVSVRMSASGTKYDKKPKSKLISSYPILKSVALYKRFSFLRSVITTVRFLKLIGM